MAITDSWLKANHNKKIDKVFEKADRDGLSVRATVKGIIIFQMRYRFNNKPARIDIGPYPIVSLKDARTTCEAYRKMIHNDEDPRLLKKQNDDDCQTTVKKVFGDWLDFQFKGKGSTVKDSTVKKYYSIVELHIYPTMANKDIETISLHQWLKLLESIAAVKPVTADFCLSLCRRALKWGVRRRIISKNELAGIEAKEDLNITKKSRYRTLTDNELALLLTALDNANKQRIGHRLMIFLALFYGCRIGELRLAKADDFDLDSGVWTVPPENHKTGNQTNKPILRPIISEILPIVQLAKEMSERAGSVYMFPTSKGDQFTERGLANFCKPIINFLVSNGTPIEHWTIHDLRRTQRTNMSKITTTEVAETMLGHKLPGIQSVYDHHDYLDEQAKAYKIWWQKLQRLKDPDAYQNVVELKKAQ